MSGPLFDDYRAMMSDVLGKVNQTNLSAAIELAGAALEVRGYGPVKLAAYEEYKIRKVELLTAFEEFQTAANNQATAPELSS